MEYTKPMYSAEKATERNNFSPVGSKSNPSANTHNGKFVNRNGKKLVSTCREGKIRTHRFAPNAIVTFDGTVCEPAELEPGTKIRFTIDVDNKAFRDGNRSVQEAV